MARTTIPITAASVKRFIAAGVPAGKPHVSLRDGRGLVLRLLPTGKASWQYLYRLRGYGRAATQRTVTLGSWPAVDVKQALASARKLAGEVAGGGDPRRDAREAKRRERALVVIALDDYESWVRLRPLRQAKLVMSSLRRGLQHLLHRDIVELDRLVLTNAIERIERAGKPGAAGYFRKCLRSFLNRQLSLGLITIDPLAGYRRLTATKNDILEAEVRSRALNEAELLAVHRAATIIGGPFGNLVKMAIATGLRRNELAQLRWSMVDRAGGKIVIPGQYMKSARPHAVVITHLVGLLLDHTVNRGGDLVFPSEARAGGSTLISGWSSLVVRLRKVSGVSDLTMHALRRTYRSLCADIGIAEPIAEILIAHRRPDLIARYNLSEQWQLRVAAAEQYDAYLSDLIQRADAVDEGVAGNDGDGGDVDGGEVDEASAVSSAPAGAAVR